MHPNLPLLTPSLLTPTYLHTSLPIPIFPYLPTDRGRFKAANYRWGCLGASWCIFILMASAILLEPSGKAVCVGFLPVLVIGTFCSVCILRTLMRPPPGDREMAEGNKGAEKRNAEKQEKSREKEVKTREVGRKSHPSGKGDMNSQKKKAYTTVVTIQAVLMLNYLPFVVCLPLYEVVPARILKCQFQAMALAAAASCSYLQPLLYLHRLGRLPFMKSRLT
ncbi:unnamed protein product [Pleuronectes platessa]|uniref:G-protein coupled receptors family 1 profile domain-containing protein n=1 Tax=Pleuronectes platessa TaxID=8262 RepID=A0A9N7VTJ5_PLEPL|nr:unnamed protein product [Pleuronectes platessa]